MTDPTCMTEPKTAPRARGFRQPRCSGCGLSAELCICRLWSALPSPLKISVVMPRSEARSASNSARLLALWLPGTQLEILGERGTAPDPVALAQLPGSALLFPGPGPTPPIPDGVRHLIVPDGTWSQARRIERRCFAQLPLPRVQLAPAWSSAYELRRARAGLCTFEATALALGLLVDAALAQLLLARFAEWTRRAEWLKAGGHAERAAATLRHWAHNPAVHPAAAQLQLSPPRPGSAP